MRRNGDLISADHLVFDVHFAVGFLPRQVQGTRDDVNVGVFPRQTTHLTNKDNRFKKIVFKTNGVDFCTGEHQGIINTSFFLYLLKTQSASMQQLKETEGS